MQADVGESRDAGGRRNVMVMGPTDEPVKGCKRNEWVQKVCLCESWGMDCW